MDAKKAPKELHAALNRAIFSRDGKAAASTYQEILRSVPDFVMRGPAQFDLATLLEKSNFHELAFKAFQSIVAVKDSPVRGPALRSAGRLAYTLKRFDECIDYLEEFLATKPLPPERQEAEEILSRLPPEAVEKRRKSSASHGAQKLDAVPASWGGKTEGKPIVLSWTAGDRPSSHGKSVPPTPRDPKDDFVAKQLHREERGGSINIGDIGLGAPPDQPSPLPPTESYGEATQAPRNASLPPAAVSQAPKAWAVPSPGGRAPQAPPSLPPQPPPRQMVPAPPAPSPYPGIAENPQTAKYPAVEYVQPAAPPAPPQQQAPPPTAYYPSYPAPQAMPSQQAIPLPPMHMAGPPPPPPQPPVQWPYGHPAAPPSANPLAWNAQPQHGMPQGAQMAVPPQGAPVYPPSYSPPAYPSPAAWPSQPYPVPPAPPASGPSVAAVPPPPSDLHRPVAPPPSPEQRRPQSESEEQRHDRLRGGQFALVLPIGKRIHMELVSELVARKEEISDADAKKKVLRGKGILYDELTLPEVLDLAPLVKACRQSLNFVNVPRTLRPYEHFNGVVAEARPQGLKVTTDSAVHRLKWSDFKLINCGTVGTEYVVNIVTSEPAREFRFQSPSFNCSGFGGNPDLKAGIKDFLTVITAQSRAVRSHTVENLLSGKVPTPQPFVSLEEFRTYTLWVLFSHFAELVDAEEMARMAQVSSNW